MKKAIGSALLLWIGAYAISSPIWYFAYQPKYVQSSMWLDLLAHALILAVIVVGGILLGRRMRQTQPLNLSSSVLLWSALSAVLGWIIYYVCDLSWNIGGKVIDRIYFSEDIIAPLPLPIIMLYETFMSNVGIAMMLLSMFVVLVTANQSKKTAKEKMVA